MEAVVLASFLRSVQVFSANGFSLGRSSATSQRRISFQICLGVALQLLVLWLLMEHISTRFLTSSGELGVYLGALTKDEEERRKAGGARDLRCGSRH